MIIHHPLSDKPLGWGSQRLSRSYLEVEDSRQRSTAFHQHGGPWCGYSTGLFQHDQRGGSLAELDLRIDALETKTEYEYVYEQTAYTYNAGAPPATTNGQVRFNNTNLALATAMNIKRIDSDGFDRSQWLQMLDNRAKMRIQEWDLATVYHRFNVTGPAVFDVNNAQVPIVWYEGNGTLPAQKAVVSNLVALPS